MVVNLQTIIEPIKLRCTLIVNFTTQLLDRFVVVLLIFHYFY